MTKPLYTNRPAHASVTSTLSHQRDLPPVVAAMGQIAFEGNIIPHTWYVHIKLPSGNPDLAAIIILAEIVYWHRPTVIRDEVTGQPLYSCKKFKRDMFCSPLEYYQRKFGLSKDQARHALRRLEQAGLIRREYRDLTVTGGMKLSRVTFVAPVPERILEITTPRIPNLDEMETHLPPTRTQPAATPASPVAMPQGAALMPQGAAPAPPYGEHPKTSPEISTETTTPPTPSSAPESSSRRSSELTQRQCPIIASHTVKQAPAATPNPAPDTPAAAPLPPAEQLVPCQSSSPDSAPASIPANPTVDHTEPAPLRFDFHLASLDNEQQAELRERLTRLPNPLAQRVLDEYNSAVGRRVQFRNRWGWIEFLIRAALEGRFIPTSDLPEKRRAAHQALSPPTSLPAPPAQPMNTTISAVWQAHWRELEDLIAPADFVTHVLPLRGVEDGRVLRLEAPNRFVADWICHHLPLIEGILRPHTELSIQVCIG